MGRIIIRTATSIRLVMLLLLLLAFFAQGLKHIRSASLTFDEGPHLAVGYTTLRTGDFRLQPVHIHPPLANVFAALPLLLQDDLPDPRAIDGWDIASLSAITDAIVWQYPHPERLALAGRLPILWLGVLLGALICRWAWDRGGGKTGLLALALYAFDPNSIAHGTLITTDMAATFLMVATLYAAKRQSEKAKKRESEAAGKRKSENVGRREREDLMGWMGVGVLLGLALLAKVSALMLVPVLLVIVAGAALKSANSHNPRLALQVSQFARRAVALALPAVLAVWAGYGFETGSVAGLPFAIPAATHLKIYQSLQKHYELGHPTFLLGQVRSQGWWYYFPIAFVLKTPLPILIGAAYGLCRWVYLALRQRRAKPRATLLLTQHPSEPATLAFYIFPIAYAATSLFSTVNLGYRHLLPLLPFVIIGVAGSWRGSHRTRPAGRVRSAGRVAQVSLLLWLIWGTLAVAPDYLAFFNEIAGGPAGGYRALVDSNLDWGQNLWQLRDWMTEHAVDAVFYAHYSPANPEAYGIQANFLPPDPRAGAFTPWQPAPGFYAIGATVLQGPYAPDPNFYAWFRSREPVARLGHALWIYEVTPDAPFTYAVLCAEAGLSPEQVRANLGQPVLRILQPDCSTAEVYAQGPGINIVTTASSRGAQPEFTLRAPDGADSIRIYRIETTPTPTHPYPIMTNGPLDFLGYDIVATGTTTKLHTYWRVTKRPDRLLSLMAHLVAADGTPLAIGDGMGFPIDQWNKNDIIVQQHLFHITSNTNQTFHIGGYWLDTMERWLSEKGKDYWRIETAN